MKFPGFVSALVLFAVAGFSSPSISQEKKARSQLVGLWQLESLYFELKDGKKIHNFGEKPRGYAYFSPGGRIVSHFTAMERAKPQSEADMVAAFKTLYSLGGTYKVAGNTYTVKPESAHNENMIGTDLKREFKVEGNTLTIVTAWGPAILLDGKPTARSVSVWKRAR